MTLSCEWVRYGQEHQYLGYLARPTGVKGSLPGVIVFQEIWGVDAHIEDVTRRIAEAGYVAMAPDLYAVDGQRPDVLSSDRVTKVKQFLETVPPTAWNNPAERDAAIASLPEPDQTNIKTTFGTLFSGLNLDRYSDIILATAAYLQNESEYSRGRKVGSVGFCMGGALSGLLACLEPTLGAAVIFYGNRPDADKIRDIGCPVMGFYGSLDPRISGAVPGLEKDMAAHGKQFTYRIYDGAHHAFFNDTRSSYNVDAARDAFARTLTFFNEQLAESAPTR